MAWPIVCFDLDGTLLDTREGIVASLVYAAEKAGLGRPKADESTFIGPPLRDIFIQGYGADDERADAAVVAYREFYVQGAMHQNQPYPGIPELLAELRKDGRTLAVCTAKPWVYAREILEHRGLLAHFAAVSGPEFDGRRSDKPAIIRHAMSQLERDPEAAESYGGVVMIGDRHYDIGGAQVVGAASIGVTWGFGAREELEAARPDHLVDDAAGLRALLLGG